MAASLRKMGVFFGLTEDDAYADAYSDASGDGHSDVHHVGSGVGSGLGSGGGYEQSEAYDKRLVTGGRDDLSRDASRDVARPVRMRQDYARVSESAVRDWAPEPEPSATYTAEYTDYPEYVDPSAYRITTLHPRTYNEAVQIGEHFRAGTPVIMNLTEMADSDAKRLVDFAAGLTFGLHGRVERVTSKVFLLSPPNVTVTAQDKARIAENGFFNQS